MANNRGVIDWSGLQTITGPEESDDWFRLIVSNGGEIRLPNLRTIVRMTRFDIQVPEFDLPALEEAGGTKFVLADGTRLNMPSLTRLSDEYVGSSFEWGFNSTVFAPNLTEFINSDLALSPGRVLEAPSFTDIYASRLAVSGGSTLEVAAPSYDTPADWRWSPTLFSADGAGSLLDLSTMQNLRVRYGAGRAYNYSAVANNRGVIDWSGLDTITGPEESDDWLAMSANAGGALRLGNVVAWRQVRFSVNGDDSRLAAAGLYLKPIVVLGVTDQGILSVHGDFLFENTDPNSIFVENAYFQLNGTDPQRLELGGNDLGPLGSTARNFGYSQLIIGDANQTSAVQLVDTIDNGQRGAGGDAECLYLYGVDGAGLRLLNGSRLVLKGLNVYAMANGSMQDLGSLIPQGENSVPFDEGFIAHTGGPAVVNFSPVGLLLPPLNSADVAFDQSIDGASFGPEDVSIIGPNGSVAVTSVVLLEENRWRITFAEQSVEGEYGVRIGPKINESAGNLIGMDQDGDGLGGEEDSDAFVTSFTLDQSGPRIISAFALQGGNKVGVSFDEPVPAESAGNSENYLVQGLAPMAVEVRDEGRRVVLTIGGLVGNSFELRALGLTDSLGNAADADFVGTILRQTPQDIGLSSDVREIGWTVPWDETEFEVKAGGRSIWTNSDGFHFMHERRSGDFDLRVRMAEWSATSDPEAGLMFRESLTPNSPTVYLRSSPQNNNHWFYIRRDTGATTALPSWICRLSPTSGCASSAKETFSHRFDPIMGWIGFGWPSSRSRWPPTAMWVWQLQETVATRVRRFRCVMSATAITARRCCPSRMICQLPPVKRLFSESKPGALNR